jgi:5-methylcytosine-specific restriction endonuclease McrA
MPRPLTFSIDEATRLYRLGLSAREIGLRLKASAGSVYGALRRVGVYKSRLGSNNPLRVSEPVRRCSVCKTERPSTHFRVIKKATLNGVCLSCEGNIDLKKAANSGPKVCADCGRTLPRSEFHSRNSACKACQVTRTRNRRAKNRKAYNASARRWTRGNPDKVRDRRHRRRLREYEAAADSQKINWQEILAEGSYACAYCGVSNTELHMDHVLPLSRGGKHESGNIVPACKSCNSQKNTRTPDEWRAGVSISRVGLAAPRAAPAPRSNAGERHYRAKLTDADVIDIRRAYAAGGVTQKELATKHGIAASKVSEIVSKKRWKHI